MKTTPPNSAYLGWLSDAWAPHKALSPLQMEPANLVLGYATGYDASLIAPFVRSLRAVFDGSIALVVDDRPDVKALLDEHGVTAVHPEAIEGWRPHAVMERFVGFTHLLERFPNAGGVLLTDVRDVIFQADPFDPPLPGLQAFAEFEGGVLSQHAFDMKYLSALFGDRMAASLGDKACICVGTVAGPRDEIMRFCRIVLMLAAIPRSEFGGSFGADQAACNLAFHLGLVNGEVQSNFGRVATVGMTPGDSLTFRDGQIVNPDGTVSAVVHQHDRHPHLDQAIHEKWGGGMRHNERIAPRSLSERMTRLRQSLMRRLPEWR
jgi:hypothetical protein